VRVKYVSKWVDFVIAFPRWWVRELAGLVPESVRARLHRKAAKLVVSVCDAQISVRTTASDEAHTFQIFPGASPSPDLLKLLRRYGGSLGRPVVHVGRLPTSQCLVRKVTVPRNALSKANDILRLDLERATPFRNEEVYTDYFLMDAPAASTSVTLGHVIAKREFVDALTSTLQSLGLKPAQIDVAGQDDEALPVNLIAAHSQGYRSWIRGPSINALLAAAIVVLSSLTANELLNRQIDARELLDQELASAREEANEVRQSLAQADGFVSRIMRVHQQKTDAVAILRVLNELTRLLPDSAWISELQLTGGTVRISGTAEASEALIQALELSPYFAEVAFAAPVSSEPGGTESFNIAFAIAVLNHGGASR